MAVLGVVVTGAHAQAPATLAIVLKVSKDVSERSNDAADWKPVTRGMALGAGHRLRTGPDGFCAIMFRDDKSLIKVSASTEIRLEAEPAPGGKLSKKLWVGVGGVWAQVAKQEGTDFRIETPTSVASVKGTAGYDIVDASGYTTLFGLDGTWDFGNPFGTVDVTQGFQGFSNGIDPPTLTQTPPGGAPQWGANEPVPGVEQGGGQGGEGEQELRMGLEDADGTQRTLVIRYREAQGDK